MRPSSLATLCALALAVAPILSAPASAQCRLGRLQPAVDEPGGGFGRDVAISASRILVGSYEAGRADLYDAASRALLSSFGPGAGDLTRFGEALALEGSLAVVGAPYDVDAGDEAGAVHLYDAPTGQLIGKLLATRPRTHELLGTSVATDGAIVIAGASATAGKPGRVVVFDATTGQELVELYPEDSHTADQFGKQVVLDGGRLYVGAPSGEGAVYVFDVATWQQVERWSLPGTSQLGGLLDVRDGLVAVSDNLRLFVLDASTGAQISEYTHLAAESDLALASLGRVLVGYAYESTIVIVDGLTGIPQDTLWINTQKDSTIGGSVAVEGDLVVTGNRLFDPYGTESSRGRADLFSLCPRIGQSYCGPAVPNSTGRSGEQVAFGSTKVSDGLFELRAQGLPVDRPGIFLVADAVGFVAHPGGSDGNLCLGGSIARFAKKVDAPNRFGAIQISVDLGELPFSPSRPVLPGETWCFQAWYRDKPWTATNFTDAVAVTFE